MCSLPTTNVVGLDDWKWDNRFLDLLMSNSEMLNKFLLNPERFVILYGVEPSPGGYIRDDGDVRSLFSISKRIMYHADFVMANGKILKNRWGPHD